MAQFYYFGLVAFLILAAGLAFILWKWPIGRQYTFSQHVAIHNHRIIYYMVLFCITLPLLLLFFIGWFVPTFQLPPLFSIFIVIACVAQLTCTMIPEVGGWKTKYHRIFAGISAICLIPPLVVLFVAPTITAVDRAVLTVSLAVMAYVIWTTARGKGKHDYFLYLQIAYYTAFFGAVLFVAYA